MNVLNLKTTEIIVKYTDGKVDYEKIWVDPSWSHLDISEPSISPTEHTLVWAGGYGYIGANTRPIDIDDNPCIVRGYD